MEKTLRDAGHKLLNQADTISKIPQGSDVLQPRLDQAVRLGSCRRLRYRHQPVFG